MRLMLGFMRDLFAKVSVGWRIWLLALIIVNMILPWFFFREPLAQATIACFVVGNVIGLGIYAKKGFSDLLALMHIPWLGLIPFAWVSVGSSGFESLYGGWVALMMALNSTSLVIDGWMLVRYWRSRGVD